MAEPPDGMPGGIRPPHEAFYLEAMLFSSLTAVRAVDDVSRALTEGARHDPESDEWHDCAQRIVDGIQVVAHQAAALSRYLWPPRARPLHEGRAKRLRDGLGVSESSPLLDRELRNTLEHFDERLDEFCAGLVAGIILPTYVGPMPKEQEVPTYLFRAYYTDTGVFEILGRRWAMQPVVTAIEELHETLVACAEKGGRLPAGSAE